MHFTNFTLPNLWVVFGGFFLGGGGGGGGGGGAITCIVLLMPVPGNQLQLLGVCTRKHLRACCRSVGQIPYGFPGIWDGFKFE